MGISFTQISEKLPYKPSLKSMIATYHSDIITYISDNFDGTYKQKHSTIQFMNSISYRCLMGDDLSEWNSRLPFKCFEKYLVDDSVCRANLGNMYILERSVNWDIEIKEDRRSSLEQIEPQVVVETSSQVVNKLQPIKNNYTPKEDLYLQPPVIPQFDPKTVWMSGNIDGCVYAIYRSLPVIPTKQNEISVTTDINKMTDQDLLNLYPSNFIPTRSSILYDRVPEIEYDDLLGSVLPIDGYTYKDRIDNIIKYPHFHQLMKSIDGNLSTFYSTIEISGELYKISDIWYDLPESKVIPYNVQYLKEYVVRRYLLERDVSKIDHKYKLFGDLSPYLTLFMPSDMYMRYGHDDKLDIARQCVKSRISYKTSRNPIIRRLNNV